MAGDLKPIETRYAGCRFRSRLESRWAVFFDALGIKWEYEKEGYDLGEAGWYLPDFWLPEHNAFWEVKPAQPDEEAIAKAEALWKQSSNAVFISKSTPSVLGPSDPTNSAVLSYPAKPHWARTFIPDQRRIEAWEDAARLFVSAWKSSLSMHCPVPGCNAPICDIEETRARGPYVDIELRCGWPWHCREDSIQHRIVIAFGYLCGDGIGMCVVQTGYDTYEPQTWLAKGDVTKLTAAVEAARSARFEHGESG